MIISSADELAHAVNNELRLGLTPRPWNIYQAAGTFWWLVPSGDWPAYRYGKLAFSLAKDVPRKALLGIDDDVLQVDRIFAGLNIEKGYGEVATIVDPVLRHKTAQIMDRSWLWWKVIEGDGPTRFARTLDAASASGSLFLYAVSSYVHDRDSTVQHDWDAVVFACRPTGISAVLNNRFPVGILRGTEQAKDFQSLAAKLRTIDDYHWVDLYIGTHVAKGNIDVKALYHETLSHFDAWVVAAPIP